MKKKNLALPGLSWQQGRVLELFREEDNSDGHEDQGEQEVDDAHGVDGLVGLFVDQVVEHLHAAVVRDVQHHVGHHDDQEVARNA